MIPRIETALDALLDWCARAPWRGLVVIGLVALAVILPGLEAMPVTDRDEARFAQATKQMLETGDYIDIRFQEQPRWKKPIGIYWLQAVSVSLFDARSEIWAYRVPSALAVFFAALLTAWAARPVAGTRAAVLAGLMTATTLLAVAEAHIAKTDAALMLTAVSTLGALIRLQLGEARWGDALIFWLAIAAAILLKGPIVPLIAGLTVAAFWLLVRRPDWAAFRALPGLGLTALLVLPWLIAIAVISEGAFFAESIGKDMMGKVAEGKEKHWGPPGLYLALVWLTLWPWAALIPVAAPALWRARGEVWLRLLAGWVVPFWLILEFVPTKLPHYVLPLYPALLIAMAWAVLDWDEAKPWQRWASALLLAVPVGVVALAMLIGVPVLSVEGTLAGAVSGGAIVLVLLALGAAVIGARAALQGKHLTQAAAGIVAACALYPAILQFQLPAIGQAFPSARMAAGWERLAPCAEGPLISLGYREPSLAFHAGTRTRMLSPWAITEWRETPNAAFLLEMRYLEGMQARAPEFFDQMVPRGGPGWYFNYNRGKGTEAVFYTSVDPRWQPCDQ